MTDRLGKNDFFPFDHDVLLGFASRKQNSLSPLGRVIKYLSFPYLTAFLVAIFKGKVVLLTMRTCDLYWKVFNWSTRARILNLWLEELQFALILKVLVNAFCFHWKPFKIICDNVALITYQIYVTPPLLITSTSIITVTCSKSPDFRLFKRIEKVNWRRAFFFSLPDPTRSPPAFWIVRNVPRGVVKM